MKGYLERLKTGNSQERPPEQPPKLPKGTSGTFGSSGGGRFPENEDPKYAPTILTREEETAIRAWLAYIGETDPENIDDVLNQCRADPAALAGFLRDAEQVPPLDAPIETPPLVTCATCAAFMPDPIGDGSGVGDCAPVKTPAVPRYPNTARRCDEWTPRS